MSETLKVWTLGGLSIEINGSPVSGLVSRKAEALFVYLVCERRDHPREILAELFWGDSPQHRAMANLRMALTSLRGKLAPFIKSSRSVISFNLAQERWLDIADLDSAIDRSSYERAHTGHLSPQQQTALEKALDLYKGDFLAGFSPPDTRGFEMWVVQEQERILDRVVRAMEWLVAEAQQRSDLAASIALLKRVLQLDPLREEAHRVLMQCYFQAGQRAAALEQYETCEDILRTELDLPPEEQTTSLYHRIRSGELKLSEPVPITNHKIPLSPTPFVGRPKELIYVAERLGDPTCRLLTVVGLGGIGKTRLAIEAANANKESFRNGVVFVSLAAVNRPELLFATIADAMEFPIQRHLSAREQLSTYLVDKQMLLVLDNFEHLLNGTDVLNEIIMTAPQLKFLVTSRERLNISGEWLLPLDGLSFPFGPSSQSDSQLDAIKLFVQSARRLDPNFKLNGNEPAIARICRFLGGMPLGIELASSWLRMMSCEQIAEQLEADFDLLSDAASTPEERHHSLRATFEHSWDMLNQIERECMMHLAVFQGGFDLVGVEAVAHASILIIRDLVDKSLISPSPSGRYTLHEVIKRYAFEKLTFSGSLESAQESHLAYFSDLAHKASENLELSGQAEWLRRLDRDIDNLRAAMEWAIQNKRALDCLEITTSLARYWRIGNRVAEGLGWLRRGIESSQDRVNATRALALYSAGALEWHLSNYSEATRLLKNSIEMSRTLQDSAGLARGLNYLGAVSYMRAEYALAQTYYEESLTWGQTLEEKTSYVAHPLNNLGLIAEVQGNYEKAADLIEQALAIHREAGNLLDIAHTLNNLAEVLINRRDFAHSHKLIDEACEVFKSLSYQYGLGWSFELRAQMALAEGEWSTARDFAQQALHIGKDLQNDRSILMAQYRLGFAELKLGDLASARQNAIDSALLCVKVEERQQLPCCLALLAGLADAAKLAELSVSLVSSINVGCHMLGVVLPPWEANECDRRLADLNSKLKVKDFESSIERGRHWQMDNSVEHAILELA